MNLFDLTGRRLVTGSSRGIGFALAKGLLEAGARVVIHGRDVEQATVSAARLAEETGGETEGQHVRRHRPWPPSTPASPPSRSAGAPRTSSSTTPASSVGEPFVEFSLAGLERPGRHQPDQRIPGRPAGRPGHGRPRQRQDHQHRVGAEPAGPARHRPVQRDQGRHRDADQRAVRRPRPARHPGQRAGARATSRPS